MGAKRGYRINVQNLKFALVTTNTTEGYEIGEVKSVPGLMKMDFVPLQAAGQLFGDGKLKEAMARLTGATLKLDANKIPIDIRAMITGSAYKDGILDMATTDISPDIAVYCETEGSNGGKEQLWFLNGKAQPFGISATQQEGNITYSTDTLTIECKERALDHRIIRYADTEVETMTDENSAKLALHPDMKDTTAATQSTEQTTTA